MTHVFLMMIYCGYNGDDKLKLTKFDNIAFRMIIAFMKGRLCLIPYKHLRALVTRVALEPASNTVV